MHWIVNFVKCKLLCISQIFVNQYFYEVRNVKANDKQLMKRRKPNFSGLC